MYVVEGAFALYTIFRILVLWTILDLKPPMSLRQSISKFAVPCLSRVRNFHGSKPRYDLVAPPHPVSHFRPIIYGDVSSQPPPTYLRHPYSLSEFTTGTGTTLGDHELQFLLQRQQLDTFHHSFWLEVSV